MVEANDMGAVHLLAGRAPFVAGLHLNAYNPQTLALLAKWGACRWVLPAELSREALRDLQQHRPASLATEVFAYGRLPLALSARCFTARHHNTSKDDCGFRCVDDPGGLALITGDGERFLTVNGIQVQSARVHNLIAELADLEALGVDALRISPQAEHTVEIVRLFRECADQRLSPATASERIAALAPGAVCNGYWYGRPGIERLAPATA